jgi:hypothetical protein
MLTPLRLFALRRNPPESIRHTCTDRDSVIFDSALSSKEKGMEVRDEKNVFTVVRNLIL